MKHEYELSYVIRKKKYSSDIFSGEQFCRNFRVNTICWENASHLVAFRHDDG